jgi:hypothetical protein
MIAWILAPLAALLAVLALRRKVALWRRLVFAIPLFGIAAVALLFAAGMRMEREGGGIPKFVTFQSAEKQAEKIEADRAQTPSPEAPKTAVEPVKEPAFFRLQIRRAVRQFQEP